jgi:CheY-like chemotaxis protein
MLNPTNKCAAVLVDDNEVDLFLHEKLVSMAGIFSPISSFVKPAAALDYLATLVYNDPKADYPIIVFLDIKMPEMDGFSFITRFETLPSAIRNRCHIVVLTSSLYLSDAIRAEANPTVAAFMYKPLTVRSLKELSETLA